MGGAPWERSLATQLVGSVLLAVFWKRGSGIESARCSEAPRALGERRWVTGRLRFPLRHLCRDRDRSGHFVGNMQMA